MHVRPVDASELAPVWNGLVADDLRPQRDGEWFGIFHAGTLAGVAHLVRVDGFELFDDLWVQPPLRRQGLGRALVTAMQAVRADLWLICDERELSYYQRFGFVQERALPDPIARRYAALGQWPRHGDHPHFAMHWRHAAPDEA